MMAKGEAYNFWSAVRDTPLRKILWFHILFVRHLRTLMPLLRPRRGSYLQEVVRARPEITGIALSRYMATNWDTPTRVARLVDHYQTVADIGGVVDFPPDTIVDLISLAPVDVRYRITLDQARWLLREGSLILSLWDGLDRIFHLGFCLSTESGKRVAYVGSLQGRSETDVHDYTIDILDRYRQFSKAAAGMRPRDFLVEVFKMFCKALDVSEIRAVADINHPQRQIVPDIKLSYDEIWIERGGNRAETGFFVLPVAAGRRDDADIPGKKRAMYVKRYAMLDAVEKDLVAALHSCAGASQTRGRATAS
jgi:uncharacterized protein VirK/YbjX